jgi:hypothetical protein
MSTIVDHYATLGISPDATHAEVLAAYKRAIRQYHPDRLPRSAPAAEVGRYTAKAAEVNAAKVCLGNPGRRADYDLERSRPAAPEPTYRPPAYEPVYQSAYQPPYEPTPSPTYPPQQAYTPPPGYTPPWAVARHRPRPRRNPIIERSPWGSTGANPGVIDWVFDSALGQWGLLIATTWFVVTLFGPFAQVTIVVVGGLLAFGAQQGNRLGSWSWCPAGDVMRAGRIGGPIALRAAKFARRWAGIHLQPLVARLRRTAPATDGRA